MTKGLQSTTSECTTSCSTMSESALVYRLRKRAEIRRKIVNRQERDRISDLLEEAADALDSLGYRDDDEQQGASL